MNPGLCGSRAQALDMAHLLYFSPPEPGVSTGAIGSGLTCRQQSLWPAEIWKRVSRVMGSDLARQIAIASVNMQWTGRGRNRPKQEDKQRPSPYAWHSRPFVIWPTLSGGHATLNHIGFLFPVHSIFFSLPPLFLSCSLPLFLSLSNP